MCDSPAIGVELEHDEIQAFRGEVFEGDCAIDFFSWEVCFIGAVEGELESGFGLGHIIEIKLRKY